MNNIKKLIQDFSSALKAEQANLFINPEKFSDISLAKNAVILHLEKENITLYDILETIACANTSKIVTEKINENTTRIKELKSLFYKEI